MCLLFANESIQQTLRATCVRWGLTVCFSGNLPLFPSFHAVSVWGFAGWESAFEYTTGTMCTATTRQHRSISVDVHNTRKQHCRSQCSAFHLGRNASVLQQHSSPDSWMTSHKFPVTADFSSSQQGFRIQIGEDTEQAGTHLQNLWTDDLIRFRRALFMTTGFTVEPFRAACRETQWVYFTNQFD